MRVFVTCVTFERHPAFRDPDVCRFVLSSLLCKCDDDVEVTAWCLMPDHGHLLLTGRHRGSQIPTVLRRWKQATGYWYSQLRGRRLWQNNYWDYVIGNEDDTCRVVCYIVSDPVRRQLVASLENYEWWGSAVWSRAELIERVAQARIQVPG